ncbi:MAG: PilZ domain-containing protein [Planctomycetota bacterium]|nr:PilZ domain-containing protein [Planctomycetota bacterium]
MSSKPSSRSSRRGAPVRASKNERTRERAPAQGTVWISHQNRLVPAGALLDLSETGVRYRHDPSASAADGFPVAVPQADQPLMVAVTMRASEQPKGLNAEVVRVEALRDGGIEVACRFEAQDAKDQLLLHRKYVEASLQRSRKHLSEMRARLLHDAAPRRRQREPLGRVLVKRKALDKGDLERFLDANRSGVRLGSGLVSAGLVSSRQLAEALSEHLGLPFVDLDVTGIGAEARGALPEEDCARLGILPFDVSSRTLRVAATHPLTLQEREDLESRSRMKLRFYLADPKQILKALDGSAELPQRAAPRISTTVLARYRFYGSALQQLDPRTFEGGVANVSDGGMLMTGPAPEDLVRSFEVGDPPRVFLAAQLFHGSDVEPAVLRFEPVRIARVPAEPARGSTDLPDTPRCWIGARIAALVPEDRKHLARLYGILRPPQG